ncbi:hypothetical protein KUTeg_018053 [Tegillarca granosa]|uniref:Major facilitator superfamily (MFS) profile domain-containing protein n=1 Tax=Tegillarca granosa TaxID=220873 RepID=A0ABQ9EM25_TEGGR|nr:hypothetical protein KUTeg_018053 [Tegillarca granosa]
MCENNRRSCKIRTKDVKKDLDLITEHLPLYHDTGSFSLLGKFGISSTFNIMLLYTPEMYPTNLRIGMAAFSSKFGGMIAFYSMILARTAVWAPGVIFGGLCLIVTVLITLLPDTRGHELPQFIEELKVWYKVQSGKNKKKQNPIYEPENKNDISENK